MPSNPNNREYFEVTGTPVSAVETFYEVQITGASGSESWYYRTKTDTGDFSAYSSAVAIVVDSVLALGNTGVSIKFTRADAVSYTAGDSWSWATQGELRLDSAVGQFDYIETIDIDDSRNLLAISSTSGDVSVIGAIDSDTPMVLPVDVNIGDSNPLEVLDFEKKNKELYIAKGKNYPAKFLGYTKNNGFEGVSTQQLKALPAIDILTGAQNSRQDAFDASVVLRAGGGADLKDAKIIAGIKNTVSGGTTGVVYTQNLEDDQLFEFQCPSSPVSLKRWYGKMHGDYCDGFAVLREATDGSGDAGVIDLWNLNSANPGTFEGQQSNMYNTIRIAHPSGNDDIISFGDFYLVPNSSNFTATTYFLVVSRKAERSTDSTAPHSEWLWRSGPLTLAHLNTPNYKITTSNLTNITPALYSDSANSNGSSSDGNEMYYAQKSIYAGEDSSVFIGGSETTADMPDYVMVNAKAYQNKQSENVKPKFVDTSRYNIEFGGFNVDTGTYGTSPCVMFTAETQSPKHRGSHNWWAMRNCLSTTAQKVVNNGGIYAGSDGNSSFAWNDEGSTEAAGWHTDTFGPFMCNSSGANTTATLYRGVKWLTYTIEIGDDNDGPGKYFVQAHMMDYGHNAGDLAKWRAQVGSDFTLPNWIQGGGEGELARGGGSTETANKGIMNWHFPPSANPNFGIDGRVIIGTSGAKRIRSWLSYVRGDSRKLLTFRFGTETGKPQDISEYTRPQMFPNEWILGESHGFPDLADSTAYSQWALNQTGTAITGDMLPAFYGIAANCNTHRRSVALAEAANSDDKLSYRISEHGNIARGSYTNPNTGSTSTAWYPHIDDRSYIMSVEHGAHNSKQLFKVKLDGSEQTNVNEYGSSDAEFKIHSVTETGAVGSWAGGLVKKVYYKASLIYDGYQESPLISTANSLFNLSADPYGIDKTVSIIIKIKDTFTMSDRVTGVALYRATSTAKDTPDPDSLFRFIAEVPLYQFNHNFTDGSQSFTVIDTGDAEGTYEAINGISENIYDIGVSYTVNAQQNGYHFIGNCSHSQIDDAENYILRSQPGKFSIFDWTKDFLQLPFIPVAMKGFMGKLYVFSNSQTAVVNPENLVIEDVIEGIGCINARTILVTDAGMVWADYRNIYMASPSMNAIGDNILNVETDGWLNIPTVDKPNVRCGYDAKRKAFLLFYTVGSVYRCWAYSIQKGRWDLFETPNRVMDTTLTKDGSTMLLLSDNRLAKFLSNTTSNLDWSWESKKINMGNTMVDKKVRNIKAEASAKALTTISYKLEGDTSWKTGTDVSSNFSGANNLARTLEVADKPKKVHWIKIKVDVDNSPTGTDGKVFATSLIYKQKRPK